MSEVPADIDRANEATVHSLTHQVDAHYLYTIFIATLASQVKKVHGKTHKRKFDKNDEGSKTNHPSLNSVFIQMARYFMDCGLRSEKEAYICILPAFALKHLLNDEQF